MASTEIFALIQKLIALITALGLLLSGSSGILGGNDLEFNIDASDPGAVLGNKVSNINQWSVDSYQV